MTLRDRVQRMILRLEQQDVNMHGFLLSVRGELKAGAYYLPFREGQPHRLYSVSKTILALAVGILADEGRLGLDDPVASYFPDLLPEQPDGRILRQTIRDMLRMATCYAQTVYNEREDADWTKPFFTGRPTHEPGTVFHYDTGASQVFASLVQRLSGKEAMDFLEERVFTPLGLQDKRYWLRDPSGCCQGGTGLCMSLRDLHRVALCLMNGGEGIVPAWFVQQMTRKQINTFQRPFAEERYGYGWQCWMTRAGWSMYGLGGQLCIACPEQDILLTTVADTRLDFCGVQKIYDAFFEEVLPCAGKEDKDGKEDTAPEMFSLKVRLLEDNPSCRLPSAGPYVFSAENPLRLRKLTLAENTLVLEHRETGRETTETTASIPFLPGDVMETHWPGAPEVPALVTAGWTAPGELRLRCHAAGDAPCGFEMLLCLSEGTATVQCFRSHDPLTDLYDGVASGTICGSTEEG